MSVDNKIEDDVEQKEKDAVLLEDLKAKAELLGIDYHPKIGLKKLREKINLHLEEFKEDVEPDETQYGKSSVGPNKTVSQLEKEARKTRLVIITDNDPTDVDNPTIVQGVQNAYFKVGPVIIRKDMEQYVPECILSSLKAKTMIKWVPSVNNVTRKPTGNKVAQTRKRYNIQYL